ncbi:class F sortase [Arthrobacter sp. C9C5]|uniref:class F sortase n=1 Tax=Arthrobacter sp. C9C5 TaxID=2735267 RepID=UPI0015853C94|nr:class F sortase [Arthrobacter sp. C9C5]NUU33243.1 class F sortase [Arthrobacter sp. C9C5]
MLRTTAKATRRLHAGVPQRSAQRSAARIAASAALVALLIAGCAAPQLSSAPLPPGTAGMGTAAPVTGRPGAEMPPQPQPTQPVQVTPAPAPKSAVPKSAIPVRPAAPVASPAKDPAPRFLTVAGTTINMPIVKVGVSPDGAMEIPEPFNQAGWYRFGPAPGAAAGTAVVAAHVDTTSDAAPFSQLKSLAPGTLVTVQRIGALPLNFRVIQVELMAKDAFDGASVFRRDGPPQLKLVTCGGRWLDEQQNYGDNVIVTAVPA